MLVSFAVCPCKEIIHTLAALDKRAISFQCLVRMASLGLVTKSHLDLVRPADPLCKW